MAKITDYLVIAFHEIIEESNDDEKIFVEEIISKVADAFNKYERYFDKKFFERVSIEGPENVFNINENNELVIVDPPISV